MSNQDENKDGIPIKDAMELVDGITEEMEKDGWEKTAEVYDVQKGKVNVKYRKTVINPVDRIEIKIVI